MSYPKYEHAPFGSFQNGNISYGESELIGVDPAMTVNKRAARPATRKATKIDGLNVLVIDDKLGNDSGLWRRFLSDTELETRTEKVTVLSGQIIKNGQRENDYELLSIFSEIAATNWSLILLDLQFVDTAIKNNKKNTSPFGVHLYKTIKERFPKQHIVFLTNEHQEELLKSVANAFYISKDNLDWHELVCNAFLVNGCEVNSLLSVAMKRSLLELTSNEIGSTNKMLNVYRDAYIQAKSSNPICILGESGSGKEILANYIHRVSRDGKPFFVTGMGELNSGDLSIDLGSIFGIEAGVATGVSSRKGLVEEVGDGTLFFDEIAEMQPGLQAACLRFLQDKKFKPQGSKQLKESKCRLLFATDRDLRDPSILRHQIFERINVNQAITIPPLREHSEDIPALAETFLKLASAELDKTDIRIDKNGIAVLTEYSFPNNIRSLKNVITYLVSLKGNRTVISADDVKAHLNKLHSPIQLSDKSHKLSDVVSFLNSVVVDMHDKELDGAATGEVLRIENAYLNLVQRAVAATLELKGNLVGGMSYLVGQKLKSDRRFDPIIKGTKLIQLSSLTVKGSQRGTSGNKKKDTP